jgi:hypothetical protein
VSERFLEKDEREFPNWNFQLSLVKIEFGEVITELKSID